MWHYVGLYLTDLCPISTVIVPVGFIVVQYNWISKTGKSTEGDAILLSV